MRPSPLSRIFAPELHQRLLWFVRLRWMAAAAMAAVGVAGLVAGLPRVWPELAVVGLLVGGYNCLFLLWLRMHAWEEDPQRLARAAVAQVVLDLAAVLVTVHLTGGQDSPVLAFLVFHMAIGTILLASRVMYLIAAAVSGAAALLFVAEHRGVLPLAPRDPLVTGLMGSWPVEVCALAALLVGVIYLTDTVMDRFARRTMELHDTTEALARHTAELERLLAEKEELQRQKSHYLRISAHQLRSPLATVRTTVAVLKEGYIDPASPDGIEALDGIAERVDSLLEIVNDLLELAKIREGRNRAPWVRNVSVSQILADIFDAKDTHATVHHVELVPSFITARAVVLDWGVPPDLVYAFENLVDNAIKYSKDDGGRVTVSHTIADGVGVIRVSDEGIGIPESLQEEVFLEFVRAPNAKHHAMEGTGLGMTIVREAIRMHGGDVSLSSREGEGTCVEVRLPLHREPDPRTQEAGGASGPSPRAS